MYKNKSILKMVILFLSALFAIGVFTNWKLHIIFSEETKGNEIVTLNEIEQLTSQERGGSPAKAQIDLLKEQIQESGNGYNRNRIWNLFLLIFCLCLFFLLAVTWYFYFKILYPFHKLESYAGELAKGNLNVPLQYERKNFFGAFTWAFDHMRKEIINVRAREKEAIENNKTVIATLSHDIKTPIASIRAYCEGLEANMDAVPERRERYLTVIMKKCDEVTQLTNDLVLHSLSDLERLEIQKNPSNIRSLIEETVSDLEDSNLHIRGELPDARLFLDQKRMKQVLENLIQNARKYAMGKPIEIWGELCDDLYKIHVRDYGAGIPPEDIPFVFDKFYRGKNTNGQPGSGLGLYITKYIINQMNGDIFLENHPDGLEAFIWIPFNKTECS